MQNSPSPSSWLIGSAAHCDIQLSVPTVSSMHCRVTALGPEYQLVDLGSTNGTWIDGQRIASYQPITVNRQQQITLGSSVAFPWDRITGHRAGPGQTISLNRDSITVGRAADNDYVLGVEIVSGHHARIFRKDGEYFIEDTNSLNGVFINGSTVRIAMPTAIRETDEIFFGSYRVMANELLSKFGSSKPTFIGQQELKPLEFNGDTMTIGRDPGCEHPIDFPVISWHHARITRTAAGIYVEDLKSRNGTFVDGKRITSKTLVNQGQEISLGSYRFKLLAGGQIAQRRDTGYTIEARNITFQAKNGKQILAPISFTACPGELIALMGTSGAGKTTLLKILNGYTKPTQGEVLYNGKNLYQHYDEHANLIGYVPQDDIVHERLKVREALAYSAELRTDYNDQEIKEKSLQVAKTLNLEAQFDEVIGSAENKTLSGGQRKRVNISLELICDTPVLFLDEPTSGLSSADAETVVESLRDLAKNSGKTIIATIHAPSLRAYKMFDSVIVLSKDLVPKGVVDPPGSMIYYGPAYPGSLEFMATRNGELPLDNPDEQLAPEYMMNALKQNRENPDPGNTTARWLSRYLSTRHYKQYVKDRSGTVTKADNANSTNKASHIDWSQWMTLARRNVKIRFRDKSQVLIMVLQAPIFAGLIWIIFGLLADPSPTPKPDLITKAVGIHFLMVVAAIWFGCNNAVRDVVGEWLIYKRERMVCLGLFSYVFSKLVVLNAICVFQVLLMLGIVYPACGLNGGFEHHFLILWLASLVGASIGLVISSAPFCKTTESAIALMPIVLLPMIGLGGGLRPGYQMGTVGMSISYVMPSHWAFEANLVREAESRTFKDANGKEQVETFSQPSASPANPPCAPHQPAGAPPCASQPAASQPAAAQVPVHDLAQEHFPKYINGDKETYAGDPDGHRHRMRYEHALAALSSMFLICITTVLVSLKFRDKTLGD
jgi:ABC-type multidrug transport system ATPase subunit